MSPRPRKATDEAVFAAAHRAMARLGPGELTLADIAGEAGLTAGALVQRFGSKLGLLRALTAGATTWTREMLAGLRAGHAASPLGAVRAYADCMAQLGTSPRTLAHNLAWLQLDLTDPVLRRHLVAQARATRRWFREQLDAAVAAGELLPRVDTRALARAVEVAISGSLMTSAIYQDGPAARSMRDDLGTLLRPYLATPATRRARRNVGRLHRVGR